MPSPVGHLIAGAAIGRAIIPNNPRVVVACAAVAAVSDLDLLIPNFHRTVTHSVGAVIFVTILAILVTGKVTGARHGARVGARHVIVVALVLAFASHLVLDWLGADPTPPEGLQLLWPFDHGWYISGWDVFRGTARRNIFTARAMWINATAVAQEIAITAPIAWVTWLLSASRVVSRDSGSASVPESHQY